MAFRTVQNRRRPQCTTGEARALLLGRILLPAPCYIELLTQHRVNIRGTRKLHAVEAHCGMQSRQLAAVLRLHLRLVLRVHQDRRQAVRLSRQAAPLALDDRRRQNGDLVLAEQLDP